MKRKRSKSNPGEKKAKPLLLLPTNPFLEAQVETPKGEEPEQSRILANVLKFLELTRRVSKDQSSDHTDDPLRSTLAFLIKYLGPSGHEEQLDGDNTNRSCRSSLVSPMDVASLLLPWVTKQLLHNASQSHQMSSSSSVKKHVSLLALYWDTLDCCLNVLLLSGSDGRDPETTHVSGGDDVSVTLSQSALNKLVPFAVQVTFSVDPSNRLATTSSSSHCFAILVDRLYRPTMDLACQTLLVLVEECVYQNEHSTNYDNNNNQTMREDHVCVVAATIRLLRTLQIRGASNPKKIFSLLSDARILAALSRLYFWAPMETDNGIQMMVRQLLWEGLFSPIHHMDGFRSMRTMMTVPNLSDIFSLKRNAGDGTKDGDMPRVNDEAAGTKVIQCYQESFFVTLRTMFGISANKLSPSSQSIDTSSCRAAAQIIPLLLDGFITNAVIWGTHGSSKRKGGNANDIAALQFRFWSNLLSPMLIRMRAQESLEQKDLETSVETRTQRVGSILFRSLRKSLHLVLTNDSYLPSYQDKDNQNFSFLERLAGFLVHSMNDDDGSPMRDSQSIQEIIKALEILVRLNHLTVHERLADILVACALCRRVAPTEDQEHLVHHTAVLISTIVLTYSKLRQLDHLFSSFLNSIDILRKVSNDGETFIEQSESRNAGTALSFVLQHRDVAAEIAAAVQGCPPGQVQDLFELLNEWVVTNCTVGPNEIDVPQSGQRSTDAARSKSDAITLFVLLVQNVRVDKHSAPDMARLCDDAIVRSVRVLLDDSNVTEPLRSPSATEVIRDGLRLCGWLLDLRMRCAFWLSESNTIETTAENSVGSALIRTILEDALPRRQGETTISPASKYDSLLDELQFLACQRIQQLHSLIHEEKIAEFALHDGPMASSSLVDEAKRLVNFVVGVASKHGPHPEDHEQAPIRTPLSRWKVLSQTAAYWAPYAEQIHIESFLRWLFSTLAIPDGDKSDMNSSYLGIAAMDATVGSPFLQDDRAVAIALLGDATFFEIAAFSHHFRFVGLSCALELMQLALNNTSGEAKNEKLRDIVVKGLTLTSAPLDSRWCPATPQQFADEMLCIESTALKAAVHGNDCARSSRCLNRILRILMVLNGTPLSSAASTKNAALFDTAMRLDNLARLICAESCDVSFFACQILCAVRAFTTSTLLDMVERNDQTILLECSLGIQAFVRSMVKSALTIVGTSSIPEEGRQQMLICTGKLMEATVAYCLHGFEGNAEPLHAFATCVDEIFSGERKVSVPDAETRVNLNLSRSIVRATSICIHHSGSPDSGNSIFDTHRGVIRQIITTADAYLQKKINAATLNESGENLRVEMLLLLGDVVNLKGLIKDGKVDSARYIPMVMAAAADDDESTQMAVSYLLACLVSSESIPTDLIPVTVDHCISIREQSSQLRDALFSGLARRMETDEVFDVLAKLLSNCEDGTETFVRILNLFHLLLTSVEGQEQRAVMASFSRRYFTLALGLLQPCNGNIDNLSIANVEVGTGLIITLIQKKDIIVIRERDLAFILTQVNIILGPVSSMTTDVTPIANDVYSALVTLVSSLLQRFPKQLYTCVPSLISTFHSLMRHALYGLLSEPEMSTRSQKFTRLCELLIPHKEVYKKHILGLVLEYIGAIRGDIHHVRKKGFLPAVYCLLDMLSQYETQQVTAMMDATAKALFGSIFQSHQKLHLYKGQY